MLKIQYISDLHLERSKNATYFSEHPIPKIGDILIIAGDVTKLDSFYYSDSFFDDISEKFDQVFMIPGNHEYYNTTNLNLINETISLNKKIRHNITLLNNQNIIYKGINFIFSTLWSYISPEKTAAMITEVADYKNIKDGKYFITPQKLNEIHDTSYSFIKNAVKNNKSEKVFIVTHHAPTRLVISQYHKHSFINDAFVTELHPFIYDNDIDFWLYGHTHKNIDDEINGTKIITNQFGYADEFKEFTHKIIEL